MDTLTLLKHRRSSKKFGDHAPNREQLEEMIQAALRAPDHGRLKPYQFVIIDQTAMPTFHQHLLAAADEFHLGERGQEKALKLSRRAPMVIGVIAKIEPSLEKVPEWEQMISAGCATYALQLAANSFGFETCWISNKWVNGTALRHAFGCESQDKIVALLMVGSPAENADITLASQAEATTGFVRYLK